METQEEKNLRLREWYQVINCHDLKFHYAPEVKFTAELADNIYKQLLLMIGENNIFFLPGDRDKEYWYSLFPKREEIQKKWHDFYKEYGVSYDDPNKVEKQKIYDEVVKTIDLRENGYHHDDHIIGTLTNVEKNIPGYLFYDTKPAYTDSRDNVYVKIQINDQFKCLPFRAYGLNIGLDCDFTKFKSYKTDPMDYTEKFEIESCKVKGLYFGELDNFNHFNNSLSNYYGIRGLGMFIYMPGRAYY